MKKDEWLQTFWINNHLKDCDTCDTYAYLNRSYAGMYCRATSHREYPFAHNKYRQLLTDTIDEVRELIDAANSHLKNVDIPRSVIIGEIPSGYKK